MRVRRSILLLAATCVPLQNGRAANDVSGRDIVMQGGSGEASAACQLCHDEDGSGKAGINAPRLAAQFDRYLLDQLEDFASGERQNAIMTPIAQELTEAQMAAVARYYSEQSAAVSPYAQPTEAELSTGAAIAASGTEDGRVQACMNCHGPEGLGSPSFAPSIAGQLPDYLKDTLNAFKLGERTNDPFRIMQHVASGLSESEIKALAAYYSSLPPREIELD